MQPPDIVPLLHSVPKPGGYLFKGSLLLEIQMIVANHLV